MALTATTAARFGSDRRGPAPKAGSALLVTGMVALAVLLLAGITIAVPLLRHTSGVNTPIALANPGSTHLSLGQPVRTSFGSLTAAEAELNDGLSSEDLGGMSHGVSSLVKTGSAQVNVVVTLANTSSHAVRINAGQFAMLSGPGATPVGKPVKVTGTTLQAGMLSAGASVDARVTFVTPTDGSALWLRYAESAKGPVTRIALGRTGKVAAPTTPHQH